MLPSVRNDRLLALLALVGIRSTAPAAIPDLLSAIQGERFAAGALAPLTYVLFQFAVVNVVLGVFNLIPIPPLDGYNVVLPLLPPRQSFLVQRYAQYGYIALLLLLVLSYGPGSGPLGWLFGFASDIQRFLLGA